MAARFPETIRRGLITDDEKEQIVDLAERSLSASQIARRLNRHPCTVGYAMHRLGVRTLSFKSFSYMRAGRPVRSFSREEDAYLTALRVEGLSTPKIARLVSQRFGHPRTAHTIHVRLGLLSNVEDAPSV